MQTIIEYVYKLCFFPATNLSQRRNLPQGSRSTGEEGEGGRGGGQGVRGGISRSLKFLHCVIV